MSNSNTQKIQSGYVILNKPKGMSSFFALRKAQMKFRDELELSSGKKGKQNKVKMGHAGTLDPLAEGVLLCGIEQGTKILSEMILSKKSYTAEIFLGKFSETDDEEGEKYEYDDKNDEGVINQAPTEQEIQKLLETKFSGKIQQTPPIYSALKISGKRACDRARDAENSEEIQKKISEEIQKKTREIEIFQIQILEYSFPKLKIFVECGSGTYIRSLARDIGRELHVGGYLTFLRRDSVGNFTLKKAVDIEDLKTENIQKFLPEMFDLPEILVSPEEKLRLEQGQRIRFFESKNLEISENTQENKKIKVLIVEEISGELVGFGEKDGSILRPRKIFS